MEEQYRKGVFFYNLDLYIEESDFIARTLRDLLDNCNCESQKAFLLQNTVILAASQHDKVYLMKKMKKVLNYIPLSERENYQWRSEKKYNVEVF